MFERARAPAAGADSFPPPDALSSKRALLNYEMETARIRESSATGKPLREGMRFVLADVRCTVEGVNLESSNRWKNASTLGVVNLKSTLKEPFAQWLE